MKPRHLLSMATLLLGCTSSPVEPPRETGAGHAPSTQAMAWRPCGSTSHQLKDIRPGPEGSAPRELTKGNHILFFTAEDGVHGRELWKSSGTGGPGTVLVRDILPGGGGSEPTGLTVVGDRIFFGANDGVHGNELWLSDGTPEGTRLVKDIISGPDSPDGSDPRGLGAFEGVFYFSADDHEIGRELWRSDGTAEGTRLVKNLASGSRSSRLSRLVLLGDERFCLSAVVFDDVTQLWCGDNTSELSAVDGQDSLFNLTAVGRRLFYIGNDEGRLSLRRTDGTLAGTRELLRAIPERPPFELVAVGRTLFFRTGTRLWKSDGTTEGTVVVEELGSEPLNLVALGSRLFFTLEDAEHGREWWVSDGTSEGTVLFADLAPGHTSSAPAAARVVEGLLFFSADTPGHGREPWVSDGTPTGTRPLDEVAPGDTSSSPMGFIRSGWDVFFSAGDGMHGEEPWALPFQPEDECAAKSR